MNPFHLREPAPRKTWLRVGLGAAGVVALLLVARQVHWHQFRSTLASLKGLGLLGFLLLSGVAMALRAARLNLIMGPSGTYVPVFRGVALGYLGMVVLPLGGGELLKMATLRSLLRMPSASVATAWVLDRVFEVLGVAMLVGLLVGLGVALPLRAGLPGAATGALGVLALALFGGWALRRWVLDHPHRAASPLGRRIEQMGEVLAVLKRPSQILSLVGVQALISLADACAIWACLKAFPFACLLSFLSAVKVDVYLMVGAAMPLLPGGMGTHQVACLLALQTYSIPPTQAFAFSVVAQGLGFMLMGALGLLAAFWPGRTPEEPET